MPWNLATIESIKATGRYTLVGGPFGSELTTRDYVDEGVPVIRGSNLPMDREFVDEGFVFVREEKANGLLANTGYPGDLIFTQRGTLGQVGLIPNDARYKRYVVSQSQMKLTVDPEKVDSRFVYYFFRHPGTIQRIKNNSLTSGVPHINLGVLRTFKIPLPPLFTQRSISEVLSGYDRLIENNRRRMVLLEESAHLLYREWFIRLRFPGYERAHIVEGVPRGWTKRSAFDSLEVLSGGTPKTSNPEFWDGDIPFYTPKDAQDEIWVTGAERSITELGLANCNSRLYPKETVFITARGTVGKLNMAQRPMAMSQSCYALIGKGNLSQIYVYVAMKYAVDELRQHAVGAVFDAIVVDTFKRINLLIPPSKLLRIFEELTRAIFAQVENLLIQNQRLRTARDLLLPRLMNGEISV